jgi:YVTN family beta-propeller protein
VALLTVVLLVVDPWGSSVPAGRSARWSSTIAISPDGAMLYVANPDSGSVTAVEAGAGVVRWEVPVGPRPGTLSLDPEGEFLYVTVAGVDLVVVLDARTGVTVAETTIRWHPAGVVVSPDGSRLFVSADGAGVVESFSTRDLRSLGWVVVQPDPYGLAVSSDGGTLYVTHLRSGELTVVDVATGSVRDVIPTGPQNNVSRQVILAEDTGRAYLPLTRSRVDNGRPTFENTVMPRVVSVDLEARRVVHRELLGLDTLDRPVSLPSAAAISPDGRLLYVVNAGSDDVSVIDLEVGMGIGNMRVGSNPRGIVLSPDGLRAWVHNALSDDLSILDLTSLEEVGRIRVTTNPLPDDVLAGKVLFHTSARPEMARDRWISCASCHLDGGQDGRVWSLADGPRNTTSIRGLVSTAPFHWSGDRMDLFDFQRTITEVQFGTGLSDAENEHLAVFLAFEEVPASPYRADAASERGSRTFDSNGCATCHAGAAFVDGMAHDVGTAGTGESKGPNFDTPSLLGLYDSAPYLHDGTAPDLVAVFDGAIGAHLVDEADIDDLVRYLLTLPQ